MVPDERRFRPANEFYAAAVQAGTKSWKAFLFGSVDSGNFITVDKTPASLWVMELSARVFGFNYWSLLVPQALEGVAAVGAAYATVRRWFGLPAAIIAGTVLAVTPAATLMFRFPPAMRWPHFPRRPASQAHVRSTVTVTIDCGIAA